MKLTIDTARDNPRLIRAAIAMVLTALDNGTALPAGVPAGTILTDNEARDAGFGSGPNVIPPPPPSQAAASVQPLPASPSAGASAPPPPPAPSPAPAAPSPAAPSATDRDSEGLPWDSRIHSSSHAKVANGTWKLAKGMSLQAAKVEGVKAELRALMALPAPAAAAVAPPPPPPVAVAVAAQPAPPPPPPVATPQPAADADPATFPAFMTWIAGLITANRWTHQHTATALGTLGLQNAVGLSARPDLIPSAVAVIKGMLGGA